MYYLAVDMLTGETLGKFDSYSDAAYATLEYPSVDIQTRGKRK